MWEKERMMVMEVPGKRRRGRPKQRWLDSIRNDLSQREFSGEDAQDCVKLRLLIRNIEPTSKWERMQKKKKKIFFYWSSGKCHNYRYQYRNLNIRNNAAKLGVNKL